MKKVQCYIISIIKNKTLHLNTLFFYYLNILNVITNLLNTQFDLISSLNSLLLIYNSG